jgi:hypothetical protein
MTAHETMLDWEVLEPFLTKLDLACHNFNHELIRELLLSAPAGFNPTDGICDLVWKEKSNQQQSTAEIIELMKAN